MTAVGVLLLIAGAGAAGIAYACALQRRAQELRELEQAMELLRYQMERFCLSTQELARSLSGTASGAGGRLFARLSEELDRDDERTVSERWQAVIAPLDDAPRRALTEFGSVFGSFGAQEQSAAAARARDELGRLAEAARERAAQSGKLCVVLGFSAGAMLSLVLI